MTLGKNFLQDILIIAHMRDLETLVNEAIVDRVDESYDEILDRIYLDIVVEIRAHPNTKNYGSWQKYS